MLDEGGTVSLIAQWEKHKNLLKIFWIFDKKYLIGHMLLAKA